MTFYPELDRFLDERSAAGALSFEKNAPLSRYASFRIGGLAAYIVHPSTLDTMTALLCLLRDNGIRTLVFGNASNVLFCDEGIDSCVIFTTKMRGIRLDGDEIYTECGVNLTALAQFAQKNGFAGLEFAYGIPGNCGGAVFMNAGAYEHSISEVLSSSVCFDTATGEVRELANAEHLFSYRHSVYEDNGAVVLAVRFRLERACDPARVKAQMEDYLRARNEKQPLEFPSAGSLFKRYPGFYTSRLIDEAGLKGASVGGAQVSEKHAGFIINRGGATASDVLALIDMIKSRVFELHGIHIECEVRYVN